MHPDLHLLLYRYDEAERARRRAWQPSKPQHPPRWRLALANGLRFAADRLANAPQPADRANRA